ncbi:MAG: hypothetical protein N3A68_03280 [Bacteroidia bacterium]|jgi:FtsZ-binding cell division protein ZapB|nr:hypothetical protein [Bacteroidia bacterium]GIV24055.1 MAG: hypothetical protein KatS3mg025_1714 [Bacteroidia bacterium]
MLGLAIIVAAVFFYKAYKLHLKNNQKIKELEEKNERLQKEVAYWQAKYESLLHRPTSDIEDAPESRVHRIAEQLENRKSSLL